MIFEIDLSHNSTVNDSGLKSLQVFLNEVDVLYNSNTIADSRSLDEKLCNTIKSSKLEFSSVTDSLINKFTGLLMHYKSLEVILTDQHIISLNQQSFIQMKNQKLLALLIKYFSELNSCIEWKKKKSTFDRFSKEKLKVQCQINRNFKLFSSSIFVESIKAVSFLQLERNSPQFVKCFKAFHDNIHPDLKAQLSLNNINLNIFNICRLEHKYLSNYLQKSVKSKQGPIKGLFCCIPFDFVNHFCAYGLFIQNNGCKSIYEHDLSSWYFNPWQDKATCLRNPTMAQDLLQEIKVSTTNNGMLSFSKYSSSVSLDFLTSMTKDNFGCVGLCRVFISNLKVFNRSINDSDIKQAIQDKNDSLFDSVSGTYYFINPEVVLPEFFIYFHIDSGFPTIANQSDNLSIMPLMNHLISDCGKWNLDSNNHSNDAQKETITQSVATAIQTEIASALEVLDTEVLKIGGMYCQRLK